MTRRLVVNADDLGLTAGVNDGILRAHEHGIVTSASLLVALQWLGWSDDWTPPPEHRHDWLSEALAR